MRAFIAVLLCAVSQWAGAQTLSDSSLAVSNFLSTGLQDPIAMRFTGANEGFVIEKGGAVKRFQNGELSTVLDLSVATSSERGLLGIALDPGYATNKQVYLYYSAGSNSTWTDNRLVRATWNGSALVPDAQPLATFGTNTPGIGNGPNHNGGPLIFGKDGMLYGATGDLNRSGIEQNNQSATTSAHGGGIYRLNTDGSIPADNPFTTNANTDVHRWYAYGVRNSFGLAVDPVTGRLWDTENGEGAYDEINLLSAGMNSGWTPIMGPDARNAASTADLVNLLPVSTYQEPAFSFERPIGITALSFLHGSAWGAQYDDAVLIGENNAGRLWLLRLNAARDGFELADSLADGVFDPGDTFPTFGTGFNVITDITRGPDGALYLTAYGSDTIYRIAPVPEPGTWVLMAAGLVLVAFSRRRLGTV